MGEARDRILALEPKILYIPKKDAESYQLSNPGNEAEICMGYNDDGKPIMVKNEKLRRLVSVRLSTGDETWERL